MEHNVAVLFVHGIQGQPKQFQFLMEALPHGVELRAPLLPGHGLRVREFRRSGRKQWLEAVLAETQELLNQGFRVVYVGHSMGCLLGLRVSQMLDHPYQGMLLLCCPFRIQLWDRRKGVLVDENGQDCRAKAALAGNSVPIRGLRDLPALLHPYWELLRLMGQVRRQKPRGPKGVSFFFSDCDEVVSLRSVNWAKGWPESKVQILKGCGHCYFPEEARARLIEALNSEL
ncbi:MAG: alpha/beta hydrolase [Oscillospiraceae bacterium]|nr:alpha/beta hydrolase [Oscillospiraceae bacterium]